MTFDALRVVAMEAAREAGELIAEAHGGSHRIETKSASIDLVTETDTAAERLITDFLERSFPDHGLLGEEGAQREAAEGAPTWIVDPLDGTTNFAHGYPVFAVSLGAWLDGQVVAGAVYDVARDEMFSAARGEGAQLNGRRIAVSEVESMEAALACSGFPYDRRERADFYLSYFREVMVHSHGVRRSGAAAVDLAWVACGRLDAFWEFGLRAWDMAAASLIIEEAGGRVTNLDGEPLDLFVPRIAATNGRVHQALLDLLEGVEPVGDPPPIPPRPAGW